MPFSSARCPLGAYADFEREGQEDQRGLRLRRRRVESLFARSGLLRGCEAATCLFPLKKDAEAYAAKSGGKVLR